jgi:hypothetical protein
MLTARGADRWTRLVHGVPDHVGLGWRPYRFLVSERGLRIVTPIYRSHDANSGPDADGLPYHQRSWNAASCWAGPAR